MNKRTLIIAEAGVNHNGDLNNAKKLIEIASTAGADYVKFQTYKADRIVTKKAIKASYQQSPKTKNETQYEMLKRLELSEEMHYELIKHCQKHNIKFLSTGFDIDSIDFLRSLNNDLYKIPSGEINNLPYIKHIGGLKKKVIMSTGMSEIDEIERALNALLDAGTKKKNITILHCTSQYPAPINELNLNAMITIKNKFDISVGYSDHSMGIEIPCAAVALGATVIEKHFTINRNMEGPDHKASMEPNELSLMVKSIRNIESALGDGIKKPTLSEIKNKNIARKSIVASKKIKEGEKFTKDNISLMRPGDGLSPINWELVIGKNAIRDFEAEEQIEI